MDIQQYKQMLEQPWGKIQYEITFAQLEHIKNLNQNLLILFCVIMY